jgi:hypothetical protein
MWLGAIIAVLAVGATIPFLRTEPDTRLAPGPGIEDLGRPLVYDLDFADERHGFALWGRCSSGRNVRCERMLLFTEDGATWSSRPISLAKAAAPSGLAGKITALGGGRIMITDPGLGVTRFYSKDSGRTWEEVQYSPSHTVAEIPTDGVLEVECVDEVPVPNSPPLCRRRRLAITLPDTGERVLLARPPNIENPTPEPRAADDGSWWVAGRDNTTEQWVTAVSRDAGRTWSYAPLPVPTGLAVNALSGNGFGPNRYVLATGWLPDAMEPKNLVAIFRSTDYGASWTQTWRGEGNAPRTLGGTAIVTADGGLLIAPDDVSGPAYQSIDGGASFTPLLDGPRLTSVRRTRAGYVAVASDRPAIHYLTSADGVRWAPVAL